MKKQQGDADELLQGRDQPDIDRALEQLLRSAAPVSTAAPHEGAAVDTLGSEHGAAVAPVALNQDVLASSFVAARGDAFRYVAAWGKWFEWQGSVWRQETTIKVFDAIRQFARIQTADHPKAAAKLVTADAVAGIERFVRADRAIAATAEQWDRDPWCLTTPGGIVDLKTGVLKPHDPLHYATKSTTATPRGQAPRWAQFLREITGDDPALIAYLQKLVGYALAGVVHEHVFAFFYGTGGNGKGVFLNTITAVLGDYATVAPVDTFTASKTDRHPTDLAHLRGARLVTAQETTEGRRWDEAKIKQLTGGDRITARYMRQDFFSFDPTFTLIVAGNHKPVLRTVDPAMRRRLHLVPFVMTLRPKECDPLLGERLQQEADGILAWAVEGTLAWRREGLHPPPAVVEATEDYFDAMDNVSIWIDEMCDRTGRGTTSTKALFQSWKGWADAAGIHAGTQGQFKDALEAKGLRYTKSNGVRGFTGLALKSPALRAV